ncbi:hypothetical protein FB45DRAFT_902954 [Roridomyces roridus]|uniref:Uncharacterized protein n=1 Tax=Roridomyces roridus TaxID=1738132 RepID=A0AAD7C405_9AGAR|nr:hypothetical protein FB45DRAFT_902954 [Roridomyces roridus]
MITVFPSPVAGSNIRNGARAIIADDDEVPPIAFLREASPSVSPVISPVLEMRRTLGSQNVDAGVKAKTAGAPLPQPSAGSASRPRSPFRDSPAPQTSAFPLFPQLSASTSKAGPNDSATRRTQAPRYSDSLIRRHVVPRERSEPRGAPARQRGLQAALEEAPIGRLNRPPELDDHGVWRMVTALKEENTSARKEREKSWQPEQHSKTALTAGYIERLEEAFGPGSVLRGEGGKPGEAPRGRKRKRAPATGKSNRGSASVTTGRSESVESGEIEDQDMERRVKEWIAELEVLVKGKQRMRREDFKALADTMKEIADITLEEGQALGDQGRRLQQTLARIGEAEIPFGDEHQVGKLARKLVKSWPGAA